MTLDDGEQVPVELVLEPETLTLMTGGSLIGAWPVKYCRISRSGRGAFLLSIDGEKVVFEPSDWIAFASVAAQRFRASTLADRIGVVRDIPNADAPAGSRSRRRAEGRHQDSGERRGFMEMVREIDWALPGWLIPTLTAVAVVLVVGTLISRSGGSTESTVTSTLDLPSTLAPPPPLFEQSLAEFTSEWNVAATTFGVDARIRGVLTEGQFESQITPRVTLQGRTDGDGTVGSLVLVIDPNGSDDETQLAIRTLNLAIRMASPDLDAGGRAGVLADLGLDPSTPDFGSLDGVVDVGSVEYTLAFIREFGSVLFTANSR